MMNDWVTQMVLRSILSTLGPPRAALGVGYWAESY
jgi:hypothetical protein